MFHYYREIFRRERIAAGHPDPYTTDLADALAFVDADEDADIDIDIAAEDRRIRELEEDIRLREERVKFFKEQKTRMVQLLKQVMRANAKAASAANAAAAAAGGSGAGTGAGGGAGAGASARGFPRGAAVVNSSMAGLTPGSSAGVAEPTNTATLTTATSTFVVADPDGVRVGATYAGVGRDSSWRDGGGGRGAPPPAASSSFRGAAAYVRR